jgi:hypothetical protein
LKAAIEKPSAPVTVATTIAKGAMEVHPAVIHAHAPAVSVPVTIAEGAVHVQTPVTIHKGAIQHDTHVAAAAVAKTTVVKKHVTRDAKGQIASVTEEHREKD